MPINYSAFPSTGEISFADLRDGFGLGNNAPFSMSDGIQNIPANNSFFMSQMALPSGAFDSVTIDAFQPFGLELEFFDDRGGTYVVEDEVIGRETVARVRAVPGTADRVPSWFTPRINYTFVDSSQPNSVMPSDFDSGTHAGTLLLTDLTNGTPIIANIKQDYVSESDNDRSYLRIPDWQGNFRSNDSGGTGASNIDNTPHTQIFSDFTLNVVNPNCTYTNVTTSLLAADSGLTIAQPVHPDDQDKQYKIDDFSGWKVLTSNGNSLLGFGTQPDDSNIPVLNWGTSKIFGYRTDDLLTPVFREGLDYQGVNDPTSTANFTVYQTPFNGLSASAFNGSYTLGKWHPKRTTSHLVNGVSQLRWNQNIYNYPAGSSWTGLGSEIGGTNTDDAIRFRLETSIIGHATTWTVGSTTYRGQGYRASGQILMVSKEYGLKAGTNLKFRWAANGYGRAGYEIMVYLLDRRTGNFYKVFEDCDTFARLTKYSYVPQWNTTSNSVNSGHRQGYDTWSSAMPYLTFQGGNVPVNSQYNIIVILGSHDAAPYQTGDKYLDIGFALGGFEFVRP